MRTQETAEILLKECGLDKNILVTDERLKEVQSGIFNGKTEKEFVDSAFAKASLLR